jgi:adenosylcobyric acid synthase
MTAKAIMFMGTGSDVGKSLIVAGLCRHFANQGLKVAPFKPQNMSNNAAATPDGGEIGRAQALQARAARVNASVHMNPILLKPESQTGAQVIVQGQRHATLTAREFFKQRQNYLPYIIDSYKKLEKDYDLILVEGAGSPAESNLREGDLANMGFAAAVNCPALLIGDIHRGGVIASLIGTKAVLSADDAFRIKGFLINKFHGDPTLFDAGKITIEHHTGWPCLGVIPHFADAHHLPAEDAVALETLSPAKSASFTIAVLRLPRIANFDDLDPLRLEPNVSVHFVQPGEAVPVCDLIIIPGSKSTMADLAALRQNGWDIDLTAHHRRGGKILGLCGGYQMLGRMVHDPHGLEGKGGSVPGLALLDVETTLEAEKRVTQTKAIHVASGQAINAYEIHLGKTTGADCANPFATVNGKAEGAISKDGRVTGTYLHGCFTSDTYRHAFLKSLGQPASDFAYDATIDATLDRLAKHLARHIDVNRILTLAGSVRI